MDILILFLMLLVLLVMGVPIAVAMIISSFISLTLSGLPINILAERMIGAINSYTLLAVPFFISAAVIMNKSGVTKRLLDFASCLIGNRIAGTAQVNVLGSLFFSGMSGSATADVASQGRMLIPRMLNEGYDRRFSAGVTATASIITSVVPPSIVMIIYGAITNVSIGALFFAGIVPGILLFATLIAIVHVLSVKRKYPRGERFSRSDTVRMFFQSLPALMTPVLILGGIRFGIVTHTEAGVLACVYSLFLGVFVYKQISLPVLYSVLKESVTATAVPMFIIASSACFGFALSVAGFGFILDELFNQITGSAIVFMFLTVAVLFVVVLFMEATSALLIFVPLLSPIAQNYGIHDIHYAIIVIMTLMLGTLTPPMGLQSFIAADIAGVNILQIDIWYFIAAILLLIVCVILFPALATFMPTVLM